MTDSDYTVIMPFFNEENTLEIAVTNLVNEDFASEIILVNDGSNDKSYEIATSLQNKHVFIKLIESKENKGKGHALKLGINEASKKYIGVLDADLEYSPNDLKNLFQEIDINNLDIVCGSRFIGDFKRDNIYVRTYLANKFLSMFFSIIHREKVTDIATCLKVFRKTLFDSIDLKANGFSIEVEILAKTLSKSDNFKEFPISYTARSYEEGKKIKLIDGFRYIYSIIRYSF
ncbi:glycosyl transferase [bacterium]|nr:MAG: glycosyl transferase [uncultured marine virus]GIR20119.1 MAG: glycosyl transferase [bacterium]